MKRGRDIHEATFGETTPPSINPFDPSPHAIRDARYSAEHELDNARGDGSDAAKSAQAIAEFIAEMWPGVVWQREQELSVNLTPGITLVGRLDLWHPHPAEIADLKNSTGFNATHARATESPFLDLQLALYAKLVMHATGVVPRVWQICHNPRLAKGATKYVTFRRQFPMSEAMIEHACRYAVHVAGKLELLYRQGPADWPRTFQCEHPYQCGHLSDCARSIGAHYTDGTLPQQGVHIAVDNHRWTRPVASGNMDAFAAGVKAAAKPPATRTP